MMASDLATDASKPASPFGLRRFGDFIARLSVVIAAGALLVIVALNGANVFGRYFLGKPIPWAEEAMLYLMMLIVFSASAAVTWRRNHIGIDLFVEWLPPFWGRLATFLTGLVAVLVLGFVSYGSFEIVSTLYAFDQRSEAMDIPVWIPQGFLTVGFLLMALMLILRFACALLGETPPREDPLSELADQP
jgi:TRAP-type C4-dicarboxylate transport system permease small subunit